MADGGNSGEVVERLQDPWHHVDASGEADRLIQVLEEADLSPGWAELRQTWLDFSGLRSGDRVLDVGCGTGVVTRDLAQRVGHQGHVVGIDPSTRLIEEAVRRIEKNDLKERIEFRCADGAALPFPDGGFDLVVASAVFGHIPNGPEVLAEMVRVARLAGTVVAFDHDIDTIVINGADRNVTRRIVHAYCDRYFTSGWSGRELYAMFRRVNLDEIKVLPLTFTSTQFDPYWKRMVERLCTVAIKTGVVSEQEAGLWRADLEQKGGEGRFIASRGYFCVRGRKPDGPQSTTTA